jgi:hypothetical protein
MYAYLGCSKNLFTADWIVQRDVIENRVGKEIHPAIPPQFGFSDSKV